MKELKLDQLADLYVHDGTLYYINFDEKSAIFDIRMKLPELDSPEDMKDCLIRFLGVEIVYTNTSDYVNLNVEEYMANILDLDYLPKIDRKDKQGCVFNFTYSDWKDIHGGGTIIFRSEVYSVSYLNS